ncbi:bifunctional UDP-N-acetylmuramoyl-tripeptide:D-alanyl-D-alanine ligase/alanine racemase [Olivibacter ginsenosidimutans]|uniref:Alanine racemase n=1 Tax=Olivibacter ginsenosidimutans TaxID=1176537 RepID=A0ABP9B9R9_9SPHI
MDQGRYTIQEIASIIAADSEHLANDTSIIHTLCYDSRKISNPAHALFFALSGQRDGHQYIRDAYQQGIRHFVVKKDLFHKPFADQAKAFPQASFLQVNEPLQALQDLAAYHRKQFRYPIIAITGSNGKTIVKEWLYQLLSPDYRIIRSPKSYNSQLGVPLSLWQLDAQYNLAIIEAGISKTGEMAAIEAMVKPTIGIFTNLGPAHDEGFASQTVKAAEKWSLFKESELVVYSPSCVPQSIRIPGKRKFAWQWYTADTHHHNADLNVVEVLKLNDHTTQLKAFFQDKPIQLTIPFIDQASIENSISCWALLLALGYQTPTIAPRFQRLFPVNMRLTLKKGIHNCSVIDDSYSNDLSSLAIALDFLKQQQQHPNKTLILSDIPTEENDERGVYTRVASLLQDKHVNQLIGVGKALKRHADLFPHDAQFFETTEQLLQILPQLTLANQTILIKGARSFGFERVSNRLTLQTHETTLEINLNALEQNLNAYKRLLNKDTKLMVMVKAFSYGSGSFEIANLLQFNQVDYLTVAYVDEGITLRNHGIQLPIVVMSPGIDTFEQLIHYGLEPEIYSFPELQALIKLLAGLDRKAYPIHIKVDTGMHRLGFEPDKLDGLVEMLKQSPTVKVASVFSHLAASGDRRHDTFTKEQIQLFDTFASGLRDSLQYDFIRHLANTAAIVRFPEAQFDMVRLGIGLYGINETEDQSLLLQPVARLKTGITQIKSVKSEDTIGYNRKGKLPNGGKIATVKIGYADGYNRRFGNGVGHMMVNGQLAPIVGDICMDMCMLDITDIDAVEGDEVWVMGPEIPIEQLAKAIGTIPYEILTGISQRVRRIYYYE